MWKSHNRIKTVFNISPGRFERYCKLVCALLRIFIRKHITKVGHLHTQTTIAKIETRQTRQAHPIHNNGATDERHTCKLNNPIKAIPNFHNRVPGRPRSVEPSSPSRLNSYWKSIPGINPFTGTQWRISNPPGRRICAELGC